MRLEADPGHVKGLVGSFYVRSGDNTADGYDAVIDWLEQTTNSRSGISLDRRILSPEEWIENPYFSGPYARDFLWPEKKRVFIEAAQGNISEVLFTGALGVGKTALLLCLVAYDVYRTSCLTSAQAFLGFPATSKLAWVLIHQNETKAKDKLLDPLLQFFDSTPYFQRDCPRDRSLTSRAYFPKKNLVVRTGVTGENAIHGDDVIFIGVTEANFLPVINDSTKKRGGEVLDVATDIIENAYRRWESRFLRDGQLQLCRIVIDSSRQYPDDALELREKRALRGEMKYPVRVFSFSQWEAKRGVRDNNGKLLYSGETFPVEVASGNRASRILELDEVPHAVGRVVWCAIEHRSSFEESIDASLRDLAGVAVEGLRPLFPQREAISDCIRIEGDGHLDYACRHPFTATTTSMRDAVEFLPALLADPNTRRPLVNPNMLRVVHCDPSVTGDAFGFAMGHVSEIVTVNRLVDGRLDIKCTACTPLGESGRIRCPRCQAKGVMVHFGRTTTCQMCRGAKVIICPGCKGSGLHGTPLDRPRIYLDMALRILPPKAGRIQFDDVAALLDKLRAIGFLIAVVTADGHQSEYFIQRQAQIRGVMLAERVSVDLKKDPYYAFRDAVMDIATDGKRRFSMYDYPPLFDELCHLEDRRDKVDHPKSGCFVGTTRIPLLNGTHPEMQELVGKPDFWVYSSNLSGEIVPGKARAFLSKYTSELVDVVLDSGAVERCTPDHLWRLRDGNYKAAQDLRPGLDRLMPISRTWPINGGYERVTDLNGTRTLTHWMVWQHFNGDVPAGNLVHHLNHNRVDNTPDNLEMTDQATHTRRHSTARHAEDLTWREKLRDGIVAFNRLPETRAKRSASMRQRPGSWYIERAHKSKTFRSDITLEALERVRADSAAINAYAASRILGCGRNVVMRVLRAYGFESWEDFKDADPGLNHKVRAIIHVHLPSPVPVYDLEVDLWSNFALASGVFVHNSKDTADATAGVVYNCERLDFLREPCIPGAMSVVQFGGRRDADSGR